MSLTLNTIVDINPAGALIGYNNVLTEATISSGSTDPSKALTPNTYERWRPTAANLTAKFQMNNVDTSINYIAIAAHNLSGETLLISTAATEGGALTDVESITPSNNDAIMVTFDTRVVREIAIQCTYSAVNEIGVVYAGKYMQMPRPIYGGHTPIDLAGRTEYQNSKSETGQFLGRTIKRKGLETTFSWQHLNDTWVRDTFMAFVGSARTLPFFIKWRPDYYDAVAFGYSTKDITPSNMGGGHRLMKVDLSMRAHSDI